MSRQSRDGRSSEWGFKSIQFLLGALIIQAVIVAYGWARAGKHFDSPVAFMIWAGAAPAVLLLVGLLWDSFARKWLSVIGIVFFCILGFAAGMAKYEPERFERAVFHGSYLDDIALYLGIAVAANLFGFFFGVFLRSLVTRSRERRADSGEE